MGPSAMTLTSYKALAVAVLLLLAAGAAPARVQDDDAGQCWDPDVEFPVPCGEDEE